jgi:hypothetical protein
MKTVLQLSIAMQRRSRLCLRTVLFFALLAGSAGARATSGGTTIDLADGTTTSGTGWTLANNVFTITDGANVTVSGTSSNRRIEVSGTATVTLNGVTIQNSVTNQSAFSLNSGANVTLHLSSGTTNTLKGAAYNGAGLSGAGVHVPQGASITIDGDGTLSASSDVGAGIGGKGSARYSPGDGESAGNITINGGTVTATSNSGAGIGGGGRASLSQSYSVGSGGSGGVFTMNGGNVTASSSYSGAGIGGGYGYRYSGTGSIPQGGSGGTIVINGGTLHASSSNSAGIGGGQGDSSWSNGRGGSGGNITINGGYVTASSNYNEVNIGGGMSDNSGSGGSAGTITVNGGTIELGGYVSTIGCTKNAGGTIRKCP